MIVFFKPSCLLVSTVDLNFFMSFFVVFQIAFLMISFWLEFWDMSCIVRSYLYFSFSARGWMNSRCFLQLIPLFSDLFRPSSESSIDFEFFVFLSFYVLLWIHGSSFLCCRLTFQFLDFVVMVGVSCLALCGVEVFWCCVAWLVVGVVDTIW